MNKLREYLKSERGRQARLAECLGCTSANITNWLNVPQQHLLAVSEFTGIPLADLLDKSAPPKETRIKL
jgi:hypothetical protein